jgi:hypothetical protein
VRASALAVVSAEAIFFRKMRSDVRRAAVEPQIEQADGPALRSDGPRSGRFAPVGRTVRACAEQFRVPSFVLCLLARFAELARNPVV